MNMGAWERGRMGEALRVQRTVRFLLAACLTSLTCPTGLTGSSAYAAEVNPTARLQTVKTTTLWKSPDGKVSARLARFSLDGRYLAWATSDNHVMLADLAAALKVRSWRTGQGPAVFSALVWPPQGLPAVSYGTSDGTRINLILQPNDRDDDFALLSRANDGRGAYNLAWRADGRYIAFSTRAALRQTDFLAGTRAELLDEQKGWRPKGAPAYEDLVFVGDRVAARAAGTMKWWLAEPKKKPVALGGLRGLCPDPKRNRLYAVAWQAGPVGIPRGCGVVCFDLTKPNAKPGVIVPFDHTTGKPYWLVDIFDATYPTTLRVSPDGKTLTFCGVKANVQSKNAWREFCIWRVPADGSKPPIAVTECGNIFKRIDVGDTHFIGWRYKLDPAVVLGDLKSGKAWRLPKDFYVQRVNTDVLVDKLLVGAARGKDVVLIQLAEDK